MHCALITYTKTQTEAATPVLVSYQCVMLLLKTSCILADIAAAACALEMP